MNPRSAKAVALICGIATAATIGLTTSSHAFENPRQASTVRIRSGEQHGSGVIIQESEAGYWVVTNQHVLEKREWHCIESSSGGRYQGLVVPLANNNDDDLDLAPGRLKLKLGGGAGGHRGLLSIEEETGTRDFCRLRVGVGHPGAGADVADYVLDRFSPSEEAIMDATYERACLGALEWLRLDFQAAMKIVNTRPPEGVEPGGSGC